jgi:hypothetical protein
MVLGVGCKIGPTLAWLDAALGAASGSVFLDLVDDRDEIKTQPASKIIPCSARSCGWRCVAPRYSVTHRVCLSRRVTEFG